MSPSVSVLMTFHDAAPFLGEAIDSVVAQTFTDWELVLVDDGSTDGSAEIARRAVCHHPDRIRLLTHPDRANRGMSASRNLALAVSAAPLVAFLDADDVFLPDRLAHHVDVLARHPSAGMVYGPMTLWYGWTGRPEDVARDRVYPVRVPLDVEIAPPDLFVAYLRQRSPTPGMCSVLVRRAAIDGVGGFEEPFTGMYEDQVFFSKIALAERVVVTDRPLDKYRQHDASASARALASGEWHRTRPNVAENRYLMWLGAYADRGAPHAAVVRRELRRAELRQLAGRAKPVRAARRARRWLRRQAEARR